MKRSRQYRRNKRSNLIKRACKIFKNSNYSSSSDEEVLAKATKEFDTLTRGHCECCCNVRKSEMNKHRRFAKLSRQEQKAIIVDKED